MSTVSAASARASRELLATAVAAAVKGAEIIRGRTVDLATLTWRSKDTADFVSDVDVAAERAIADVIHARHAGARVLGEELSPDDALGAELTFIVDPLDGTTNFLHGFPWYAVSIGVVADGALAAAVVLNVPTGELHTATAGGGARRNGATIRVSANGDPSRALIGTGFPFRHLEMLERYQRQFAAVVRGTSGLRRAGSAALDLADVAGGRFDAFWELRLAPWDVAAGVLLIREAGGQVTDFEGRDVELVHGPIVAGSPAMHAWLLGELNDQ